MKLQPAVKKESTRMAAACAVGTAGILVCFALARLVTEKVPFDWRVILSAVIGCGVAAGNFFLMSLMVTRVAGYTDTDKAKKYVKASYTRRMLLQAVWVVLAFALDCFCGMAGLLPLLIPGLWLRLSGAKKALAKRDAAPETGREDGDAVSPAGEPAPEAAEERAKEE